MGEQVLDASNREQHPVARRLPSRYGGLWGVLSVVAIVIGWLFLLGVVLVPEHGAFLYVGIMICSCGFLMEFFLRTPSMKSE